MIIDNSITYNTSQFQYYDTILSLNNNDDLKNIRISVSKKYGGYMVYPSYASLEADRKEETKEKKSLSIKDFKRKQDEVS